MSRKKLYALWNFQVECSLSWEIRCNGMYCERAGAVVVFPKQGTDYIANDYIICFSWI